MAARTLTAAMLMLAGPDAFALILTRAGSNHRWCN